MGHNRRHKVNASASSLRLSSHLTKAFLFSHRHAAYLSHRPVPRLNGVMLSKSSRRITAAQLAATIFFCITSQNIHRHESTPLSSFWWSRKARGASSGHSLEAILAAMAGESSQNHAQFSFHVSYRNIARADSQRPLPRCRRNSSLMQGLVGQCRRGGAAAWIASTMS